MMIRSPQDPKLTAGLAPGGEAMDITNPYTSETIGTVTAVSNADLEVVLDAAVNSSRITKRLSGHDRAVLLERAATICDGKVEELARLVVAEQGKTIKEARGEASRVGPLLRYCAGEARRISGEVLPLDGSPGGEGRLGFTLRQPSGVVVAITPFNYPLLLVAHKVGPALASGNVVIVKPSSYTPLSAMAFLECIIEAGFPEASIQCVVGRGAAVGTRLCEDERVRVVTFTGSAAVGKDITRAAGIKRLLMELGANCPVVILPDADIEKAAAIAAIGGTVNAGQVCISTQRILVDRAVYAPFVDQLAAQMSSITVGDPTDESTPMGSMITASEAQRVNRVINEAAAAGAEVVTGGSYSGAVHEATVVIDVSPESTLFREELFGPAVAVTPVGGIDEAISLCNQTAYGLGAGLFTRDLSAALRFVREVDAGNVHVNWSPLWRVDPMPYGGLKGSGFGKEGPRYAVDEMTESKTIVIHPSQ
jgi:acyl-CoA reductase-like NAD-dependent aldehyde dehydrogenase